ncbi:hypothetical protein L1887_01860 [Cichorium endivia]|nr:hypothetical protein L1887_01860 [Cichorium endivia]
MGVWDATELRSWRQMIEWRRWVLLINWISRNVTRLENTSAAIWYRPSAGKTVVSGEESAEVFDFEECEDGSEGVEHLQKSLIRCRLDFFACEEIFIGLGLRNSCHGLAKRADEMNWFQGMPAEFSLKNNTIICKNNLFVFGPDSGVPESGSSSP